jgi:ABC-2 type transport system ATP-binding protein
MEDASVIVAENLSKRFRRQAVLDRVSLRIDSGERVALVGANGAGKTTLIRCLLGEYACTGQIRVAGASPRADRRTVLSRIGFVPQLPPPLRMPVGHLIQFATGLGRSEPAQVEAVARSLGLEAREFWKRPFAKLSGGQQQKLLIAIALGREPEILIMDEPAANLDPEARRAFFAILAKRLQRCIMLLSSHRLDEVAPLVNRVIELDAGRVVLDDAVRGNGAVSIPLACRVSLTQPSSAAASAFEDWGFRGREGGLVWDGVVAAPERLRFLAVLSRYAGLLREISFAETDAEEETR